jgi:serine/threonine protein phosphatase PrpC
LSGDRDADRTRALNVPPPPGEGTEPGEILLQVSARSDKGLVRENNEDSFVVADLSATAGKASGETTAGVGRVGRKGVLLSVSDGMGGQEAGEIASRMAVETLHEGLKADWSARQERDAVAELRNDLKASVDRANRAVLDHVKANPARTGMGATLTAAVVVGSKMIVAHVGDSRCYLLRDGFLKCLTADQSLAEELLRRGVVKKDSPAYLARRSVLTRVVGQAGPLLPDLEILDLAQGDRILLCSDGLYGPVSDDVIREILSESADPDSAAEELVEEARRRGAPDNVTCVAAWLSGGGLPMPREIDGGGTMSVRLDARLAALSGDDTLALAVAKKDATAEFDPRKVLEDDTLSGPLPMKGPAPPTPPAPVPEAPPPAPSPPVAPPPPPPPEAKKGPFPPAVAVVAVVVAVIIVLLLLQ